MEPTSFADPLPPARGDHPPGRDPTMRHHLLAALAAWAVASATGSAAAPAPAADAGAAVTRLGAEAFAERDAAARLLERLGAAALPALRGAVRSEDPEVRRRAAAIVERIE